MPSCSNSSNIQTNVNVLTLASAGARLITTIDKTPDDGAYTVDAGITAGDVIRYDVTTATPAYKKSKADNIENAEVVGVVESATTDSMVVVIFGQIEFPSTRFNNAGSPAGASGGNDVYFLSSSTAGDVSSLAPEQVTQVVKPVLQRMDVGDFNAVVLNYIGYVVAGEVAAEDFNSMIVGSVYEYLDVGQTLPAAHIKISDSSKTLSVSDYTRLYGIIGNTFGFTEKITFDSSNPVTASMVGTKVEQKTGARVTYSARVKSVDTVSNTLTVDRPAGQPQVTTTQKVIINRVQYDITSSEVTHFKTPKITRNVTPQATVDGSSVSAVISTAMVIDDTTGVTIPTNVSIDTLTVKNKLTASTLEANTNEDINSTVNTLSTEIDTIKSTLGLS